MKNLKENFKKFGLLGSYIVLAISAFFLTLVSVPQFGISLTFFNALEGFWAFLFIVILFAGIVPLFVKKPYIEAIYFLPLVFFLVLGQQVYSEFSNLGQMSDMMFGRGMRAQMSQYIKFGLGLYLGAISSLVIAYFGFQKLRASKASLQR